MKVTKRLEAISTMELICVIVSALLALIQPVALILLYVPNKSTRLDKMATIDVLVVYLLGVYSICYLAVTINKLINRNSVSTSEDLYFFIGSAVVYGGLGIPTLVFNLIELFTHPDMFHLHIDFITAILMAIDVVLGLASSILLAFFYQPTMEMVYQMVPIKKDEEKK